jgi:hypothetical protein
LAWDQGFFYLCVQSRESKITEAFMLITDVVLIRRV